jgi:hypothetical protein
MLKRKFVAAVGPDQQHPIFAKVVGEEGDQIEGGAVRPVEVLQDVGALDHPPATARLGRRLGKCHTADVSIPAMAYRFRDRGFDDGCQGCARLGCLG